MERVATSGVVTGVHYDVVIWDFSVVKKERNSVCLLFDVIAGHFTIAVGFSSFPRPAFVWLSFFNVEPKSTYVFGRQFHKNLHLPKKIFDMFLFVKEYLFSLLRR